MLKLISDEEMARAIRVAYNRPDLDINIVSERDRVATQAQLEADRKDVRAIVQEIFEEVERLIDTYNWFKSYTESVLDIPDWEALKQKWIKEIGDGDN